MDRVGSRFPLMAELVLTLCTKLSMGLSDSVPGLDLGSSGLEPNTGVRSLHSAQIW